MLKLHTASMFQTICSGDLKSLKELLDPFCQDINDNTKSLGDNLASLEEFRDQLDGVGLKTLLAQRCEHDLTVRRPSNGMEVHIHQPSLLHAAVATWYPDVVEYLCSLGAPVVGCQVEDATNKPSVYDGLTPLHMAAMLGKLKMVEILTAESEHLNSRTSLGDTSLFEASFEGHIRIVQHLIDKGSDMDIPNHKGTTCLMMSCYADNADVIKCLIESGCDMDLCDRDGRNVMFYAVAGGSTDTVAYLADNGCRFIVDKYNVNVLMEAVHNKQSETVKYLLEAFITPPVDIHGKDAHGRNSLLYATEHESVDIMKYLLDYGIRDEPATDGRTVLMMCALSGNTTMLKFLLANSLFYHIKLNALDNRGRNCLFYCINGCNEATFDDLVRHGVSVTTSDDGITALMQTVAKNKYQFVKHLLSKKVEYDLDINAMDKDGWSAMLYSIAAGRVDLFELLESHGAQCPLAADGRTMVMQAAATGNLGLLRYIIEKARQYGVFLNQRDYDGWNALFYTIQGKKYHFKNFL